MNQRNFSEFIAEKESRIAELEAALRPFAKLANEIDGKDTDYVPCSMLCDDFNRARELVK